MVHAYLQENQLASGSFPRTKDSRYMSKPMLATEVGDPGGPPGRSGEEQMIPKQV